MSPQLPLTIYCDAQTENEWENRSRKKFIPKRWRMVRKKRKRVKADENANKKRKTEDKTPHNLVNSMKV